MHAHNTGQKPHPSHSCSDGLGVLQWSQGHPALPHALDPCQAWPLLCRSLFSPSNTLKQVSIVYLLSGLLCPEPSAPGEDHVDVTRPRTGMGRSLQHPGSPYPGLFPGRTEHEPHTAAGHHQWQTVTWHTHPSRKGVTLLLGAARQVTYPSAAPVTPSRRWHPDVGPVGERQPAGQQLSLYSVELPCAVAPAR